MAKCATCGNDYDKAMTVTVNGQSQTFDSFECAISALAPVCKSCGIRIMGHGIESQDATYCGAHCAQRDGVTQAADRIGA